MGRAAFRPFGLQAFHCPYRITATVRKARFFSRQCGKRRLKAVHTMMPVFIAGLPHTRRTGMKARLIPCRRTALHAALACAEFPAVLALRMDVYLTCSTRRKNVTR